jgi:hypothetical protein
MFDFVGFASRCPLRSSPCRDEDVAQDIVQETMLAALAAKNFSGARCLRGSPKKNVETHSRACDRIGNYPERRRTLAWRLPHPQISAESLGVGTVRHGARVVERGRARPLRPGRRRRLHRIAPAPSPRVDPRHQGMRAASRRGRVRSDPCWRLLADAWRHGAVAVRGRFDPRHVQELSDDGFRPSVAV